VNLRTLAVGPCAYHLSRLPASFFAGRSVAEP
jgi:hypothetical protein